MVMPQCVATKLFVDQLRETIMTIRTVGPSATYPTIAAAVAASAAGDIIRLAAGYSNERAVLTVQDLSVQGTASSVNIDLELGTGIGNVTLGGLADIEVWDNSGNNNITGNGGDNLLRVTGGADVVIGGGGLDRLVINYADAVAAVTGTITSVTDGGTNSVTFDASVEDFVIYTGSGNDTITAGDGDNRVRSGSGNDTVTTGQGSSVIDAGAGNDTVTTGDGGNMVEAGSGDNTVTTGAGADIVSSGGGNDTLSTGSGADTVQVSGGIDTANAGLGSDLLKVDYADLMTNVTGSLSAGSVTEGYTGAVADTTVNSVSFTGVERFQITTGGGNDDVRTGGGNDTLSGGNGNDYLFGGAGNDILIGGGDADTLGGGRGKDVLAGGQGADLFRFDDLDSAINAQDRITDLETGDTIDLSRIDADVNAAGDQAFVLVDSFSGTAGEALVVYQAGANITRLVLDTDGDGAANIAIIAAGDHRTFDSYVL
jgi:Ca2+-binding RTX toxin-like protein